MELSKVTGIGTKNISLLNSVGINDVTDLLSYYPYRYQTYKINNINDVKPNENVIIEGIVDSMPLVRFFSAKKNILSFRLYTSNKLINVSIYNRAFMKRNITPGKTITILGKYDEKRNTLVANNIILSKIEDNKIESIYHLTNGLNNKTLSKLIKNALDMNIEIPDYIPDYLNERYDFINKMDAIRKIHFPESLQEIKEAKLKLIYEELFLFMLKINYLKYLKTTDTHKEPKKCDKLDVQNFLNTLPFELTKDQISAVKEIYSDLTSTKRMNRLICGDVGSGKTIVGIISAYITYLSGYQTALMAPTEILATQHYENVKKLLSNTNMNIALLLGTTKKKEKEAIYKDLENGKIDLLIGTHALLSDKVSFKNLGLVITDEQHRFGVTQRESLRNKGSLPDILYMSATPIPRTYALTIYGDMDISLIKTKPSGRKEIKTIIKDEKEIKSVLYLMLEELKNNHQIYVVSPLIEENETLDLTPVTELKTKMELAFNNKVNIGLLHGKLTKEEKERVMNDFISGKTKVLVSTTVIEVGVDNPNATMMVIFNAERFGLATLHQLRGRIGRNSLESTCILIGNEKNERLSVLASSSDGFYITEKDYEMRKEGDIFGVRQSGDMSFKIADIKRDFKVLMRAKEDSLEFLEKNDKNIFKNDEKYIKIVKETESLD
jgi:ATP-dependent DNA helicase recG